VYKRKTAHKRAPRTAFKKGDPNNPKKKNPTKSGRKKGTPNKFTGQLRQIVLDAAANAHPSGVQAYLQQQAKKNPRSFMQMLTKLLPTEVTGKDGSPLEVALIQKAQTGLSNLSAAEFDMLQKLLVKIGIGAIPQ